MAFAEDPSVMSTNLVDIVSGITDPHFTITNGLYTWEDILDFGVTTPEEVNPPYYIAAVDTSEDDVLFINLNFTI